MSFFEVTSSEIRAKAGLLSDLNGQFRTKATDLENKEQSLCSMWEGEAKNTFHQAFMRDKSQMDVFNQLIDRYVEALLEIAAKYEEAERRAMELASARIY